MNEKKPFLVSYNFGTGPVRAVIYARSAEEVAEKYPERAVAERPSWMDDWRFERLLTLDIDDPPRGWLVYPPGMKYPCPCCGYIVFNAPPDSYEICPICFWEDDAGALRSATTMGGPNKVCLMEGQRNFAAFGACEFRLRAHVRVATTMDQRDPAWRPIDPDIDVFATSPETRVRSPQDKTKLYYWRPDYWLKGAPRARAGAKVFLRKSQSNDFAQSIKRYADARRYRLEAGNFPKRGRAVVTLQINISDKTHFSANNFRDADTFELIAYSHEGYEVWEKPWSALISSQSSQLGSGNVTPWQPH